MRKELAPQFKPKCSCCGRSQARMRWQGFRLCPTCRADISRDETLKDTMLGLGEGPNGGKGTSRIRYSSCPSCQQRVTKQYAFICTQCRTRICIYCAAPDAENLCMSCSDKLLSSASSHNHSERLGSPPPLKAMGFKGPRKTMNGNRWRKATAG